MLEWNAGSHSFPGLALVACFCQVLCFKGFLTFRYHTNWGLCTPTSESVQNTHRIGCFHLWLYFFFTLFHVPKTNQCPHEVSGNICFVYNPLQTSGLAALLNGLLCMKLMSN